MDEWGSTASPVRADFAQVNLASVLFAVADEPVEPHARAADAQDHRAGVHHRARRSGRRDDPPAARAEHARCALSELTGRFLPVTDATFWSDTVGEAKQSAVDGRRQPRPGADPRAAYATSTRGPGSTARPGWARSRSSHLGPSRRRTPADAARESRPAADLRRPVATPGARPPLRRRSILGERDAAGPAAVPSGPSVPSTRTGALGRVHGTGASMDLPRPADDAPATWRPDKDSTRPRPRPRRPPSGAALRRAARHHSRLSRGLRDRSWPAARREGRRALSARPAGPGGRPTRPSRRRTPRRRRSRAA